jgi:hypothetical protein
VSKIIRLASAALLALVIMGNISGFDSSVSSVNPQIPRVAQSKPVQEESTTSQQKTAKPVFAGDLMGYLYLCCSHREQKKRTSDNESKKQIESDLRPVFDALSAQGIKATTELSSASLLNVLKRAGISIDSWNSVVHQISQSANGRKILDEANVKGEAMALGLPKEASARFRKVERRLAEEQFDVIERERVFQLLGVQSSADLDPKTNKVTLHTVKTNPTLDLPADAFNEYKADISWLIGAAYVKALGALYRLTGDNDNDLAIAARNRSWLKPVGTSVLSPTIKSLISELAKDAIETEITPIPATRGCALEMKMQIKKGKLPLLIDKLRRESRD